MSPCLERLSIRPLFEDEEHLQLMLSSVEIFDFLRVKLLDARGSSRNTGGQGVSD